MSITVDCEQIDNVREQGTRSSAITDKPTLQGPRRIVEEDAVQVCPAAPPQKVVVEEFSSSASFIFNVSYFTLETANMSDPEYTEVAASFVASAAHLFWLDNEIWRHPALSWLD